MTVGECLREARKRSGKTQADIAAELGKKQPTVHAWESDQTLPRTDEVRDVARAYNVKPEKLLPPGRAA